MAIVTTGNNTVPTYLRELEARCKSREVVLAVGAAVGMGMEHRDAKRQLTLDGAAASCAYRRTIAQGCDRA